MKPPPFEYALPKTVDEAAELLSQHGDEAKVLAGGQSLLPLLALRLARPSVLVDVNRVAGLDQIENDDGVLRVGALVRHAFLQRDAAIARDAPLLAKAAPMIGHFQIRNRGTIGGALAHGDSAAEWPAVAVALDAELETAKAGGHYRRIPAADFFESTFLTALEPDELLVSVRVPIWGPGSGFAIEELARRSGDFAIAGVLCGVQIDSGKVARIAISMLGMASKPIRGTAVEQQVLGASADDLEYKELAEAAIADLDEPPGDIHASSSYRRRIAPILLAKAMKRAVAEAKGE